MGRFVSTISKRKGNCSYSLWAQRYSKLMDNDVLIFPFNFTVARVTCPENSFVDAVYIPPVSWVCCVPNGIQLVLHPC